MEEDVGPARPCSSRFRSTGKNQRPRSVEKHSLLRRSFVVDVVFSLCSHRLVSAVEQQLDLVPIRTVASADCNINH